MAGSEDRRVGGFPVAKEALPRTVRLVTTARLRNPVLADLVGPNELDDLAEIEGATSGRLRAQQAGLSRLDARELVHGVPHATLINASFVYPKPGELSRFSGPGRGAWYAALVDVDTALAEVGFHMTRFLSETAMFEAVVDYAEMWAAFIGDFVELRGVVPPPDCLNPDPAIGYPAGSRLAEEAVSVGLNGIVYPALRHVAGECIAALRPAAVQSVAQGAIHRITWSGTAAYVVERDITA